MNCPNCHEAVDEFDHLHNTGHGVRAELVARIRAELSKG